MFKRSSRLSSSVNALIITENNAKDGVFDLTITTSVSCSVFWECSNGYREVTIGTSHALSYTAPDSSPRRWVVRCAAGLGAITAIDCSTDAVTRIKNLMNVRSLSSFHGYANPNLLLRLSDIAASVSATLNLANSTSVCGSLAELTGSPIALLNLAGTSVTGPISALSTKSLSDVRINALSVTGALSDFNPALQNLYAQYCVGILPASIAHLKAIRNLLIYSMGWLSAGVDTVLLSASDAVWADANHFSCSAPSMQIGGTNQAPGGSAGADTTDPAVTPGNGNSNTDWQWDAGKSAHKALTGKASVYYLTHLATHQWAIAYT